MTMPADKFRARLRRALPYKNIVIQCDETTTPVSLAERGMVCAVVTYCPDVDEEGNVVEGFHKPDGG